MKVSIRRSASAFRTDAGVFYALFELLLDACADPAEPAPEPTCVAFGTLAQVTAWIFARSIDIETGMLRMADLLCTPESYIYAWKKALAWPTFLFSQPVFLDTKGPHASIQTSSPVWYYGNLLPRALERLRAHGYDEAAGTIARREGVLLDLHDYAPVLASLFGYDPEWPSVTPSHIIRPRDDSRVAYDLAPQVPKGKAEIPSLALRQLRGTNRFVLRINGHQALFGSLDEIYDGFARRIAAPLDTHVENGGVQAIEVFRNACAGEIAPLERGYGVQVHPGLFRSELMATCRGRLALLMRDLHPFILPGKGFAFSYDQAERWGLVGDLTLMPAFALDLVSPTRMQRYERLRRRSHGDQMAA